MPEQKSPIGPGYFQVYTGEGKGKTTAAIGLAVRAAGAGLKVFFAQFLKGGRYSETAALERFSGLVTVRNSGTGKFVRGAPSAEDVALGIALLEEAAKAASSGEYDIVILDEAAVAVSVGLFSEQALLELVSSRAEGVELVVTGRGASEKLIAAADLATEMRELKHYFRNGVQARKGIEL